MHAPTGSPRRHAAVVAALLALAVAACGGGDDSATTTVALCGNGRLDAGEICDDGNRVDEDACTAVCRPARCGDGAIQAGVEQCDGTNIPISCTDAGFGAGAGGRNLPGCDAACQYDFTRCGAAFTPTVVIPTATATQTPPPTSTPTPTPTADAARCGDHLLEVGESCAACAVDCTPAACTPDGSTVTVPVAVSAGGRTPTRVRVLLTYRTSALSLPGTASETSVRQRVRFAPPVPDPFMVTDLDYGVRIDSTRAAGLPVAPSPFATARFDVCSGAAAPTQDDVACFLETCSDPDGPIPDCRCEVLAP